MASSGTWADLLATRLRTLEPFALRVIAEAQVAAARAPIAQLQAHRAIAEAQVAAARAPIAQLQAHRAIAEAQVAAAWAPIAQLQAHRAIAEAQVAASRAWAQLEAHLGLPAAAPTHATPPAVPSPPPPPTPPDSLEAVANATAARIKARDYDSIDALAQEFAPRLVMLGLLRRDSLPETCLRRFQEFCRRHVYGVRIPDEALPAQIRSGRRTGGRRR